MFPTLLIKPCPVLSSPPRIISHTIQHLHSNVNCRRNPMLKKPGYLFSFGRLNKKRAAGGDGGDAGGASHSSGLRWRLKSSKKRPFRFLVWLVDTLLFKVVSFFEAVVLVSRLAFFFLFCGCHIWSDLIWCYSSSFLPLNSQIIFSWRKKKVVAILILFLWF